MTYAAFLVLLVLRPAVDMFADVGLGPLRMNPPSLVGLAMIALAGFDLVRGRKTAFPGPVRAWGFWLASLVPAVLVAFTVGGGAGLIAVREWIRLLSVAAVFSLAYRLFYDHRRRNGIEDLLPGLVLPLAAALYQALTGTGIVIFGWHRVTGTFSHPNALGQFLVLFIGLTWVKARTARGPAWYVLIVFEMAALLQTLSVSAFILLIVLGAWLFIREAPPGRRILVVLAAVFLSLLAASRPVRSKLKMVESLAPGRMASYLRPDPALQAPPDPARSAHRHYSDSLGFRLGNWSLLVRGGMDKPWLGHGLQTTTRLNPFTDLEGRGYAPHNDLIRYFFESGALGLLAYLCFSAFTGAALWRAARAAPRRGFSPAWAAAGLFLIWQLGGLVDNMISSTAFQFTLWAWWGFLLGQPGGTAAASGEA